MLVFGVLQIILFFKLWGMTNDVRKMALHFCKQDEISSPQPSNSQHSCDKFDKEEKFAIYKPENFMVKILSEDAGDVFKCARIGTGEIYYFKGEYLDFDVE